MGIQSGVFPGENRGENMEKTQGKTAGKPSAKEYLKRAYLLDLRIKSKEQQLLAVREMATKATSTMSATRVSGTGARSRVEEYGSKAVDLEAVIQESAARLIAAKYEIMQTIELVPDETRRTLLELRYLNFWGWGEIEEMTRFSHSRAMEIHRDALRDVGRIIEKSVQNRT